jgi:hypothetical protein
MKTVFAVLKPVICDNLANGWHCDRADKFLSIPTSANFKTGSSEEPIFEGLGLTVIRPGSPSPAALLVDRPVNKALAFAISAGIVGFGAWILVAGLSSSSPVLWFCVALVPIAIGLLSAFGPK